MRKKIVFGILFVLLTAFAVAACNSVTPEEQRALDGFVIEVRFHANGGSFDKSEEFAILVQQNSAVPPPGFGNDAQQIPNVQLDGYSLVGWYEGEIDGDGNVVLGDRKWDFAKDRVTESITLYARWQRNFKFQLNWSDGDGEGSKEILASGGKLEAKYETYKKLRTEFGKAKIRPGYSILGVYYAEDVTFDADGYAVFNPSERISDLSVLEHPLMPEAPDYELYVEWIKGDYIFVNEYTDMVYDPLKTGFYLENPDKEIDFQGKSWSGMNNFRGKIIGNGHTIKNLKMTYKNLVNEEYFGLMQTINGAHIEDLIFLNCVTEVIYEAGAFSTTPKRIGFLAGSIKGNSVISGIVFENCELFVSTSGSGIIIIPPDSPDYYYGILEDGSGLDCSGVIDGYSPE